MASPNPLPPVSKFVPEMGKLVPPKPGKILITDTGSMRGKDGIIGDTWVDLEEAKMGDIKEGDDILFAQPKRGTFSAHRVKRVKYFDGKPYFITHGINNQEPDPIVVTDKEFVGKLKLPSRAKQVDASSPIQPVSVP